MSITSDQKIAIAGAIQKIVRAMNLDCQVEMREDLKEGKNVVEASLSTPDQARFLIGKNGQNLQALEHVLRAMFLRDSSASGYMIAVDVNDYKKSRALHVIELAHQAVARVRSTRKAEALAPMSAYERRVVHTELASMPDIVTESIGQEPQRRIIVKPHNP